MKKIIATALVAGVLTSGYGIAFAACDCQTQQQKGTISVNTTAKAEVAPDTVEINIAVKTQDSKSLQKAAADNKLASDKVYEAAKALINSQNGDYIKTADYNARPVYKYVNNKRVFDKYEVSNSIIVHTKNIDKIGKIIDTSISLGATDINDLQFSISNYEKQCNELLVIAANKAKTRADSVAKASATVITGVKDMSISCSENSANHVQYRYMAKNMMSAGMAEDAVAAPEASTPIQSGIIKIYANLNAVYYIK